MFQKIGLNWSGLSERERRASRGGEGRRTHQDAQNSDPERRLAHVDVIFVPGNVHGRHLWTTVCAKCSRGGERRKTTRRTRTELGDDELSSCARYPAISAPNRLLSFHHWNASPFDSLISKWQPLLRVPDHAAAAAGNLVKSGSGILGTTMGPSLLASCAKSQSFRGV
jgi:hypothetical protein